MSKLKSSSLWAFFLVGFLSFAFSNGAWSVPITTFVFPICFLFISRQGSPVKGLGLVAVAIVLGGFLKYPLSLFLGFPYDQILEAAISILSIIPFVIDRIFYPKFTVNGTVWRRFVGSLIFPLSFAAFEILLGFIPLGVLESIAVIQHENYVVSQICSILGQPGLSFFTAWVASFIYFIGEQLLSTEDRSAFEMINTVKKPLIIFLSIYLVLFTYGGLRIYFLAPSGECAKVALTTGPKQIYKGGKWSIGDNYSLKDRLKIPIEEASAAGAKLILFNEYAFPLTYTMEHDFQDTISQTVKKEKIYAAVPVDLDDPTGFQLGQSKLLIYDPNGNLIESYTKSHLIPFIEDATYQSGPDRIPDVTLNLSDKISSKTTASLGLESSLLSHMNDSDSQTDIHLAANFDWEGLGLATTYSTGMRSIEFGMSTIMTNTFNPLITFDYLGIPTSISTPQSIGYGSVAYAYIPLQGVSTFYGMFGKYINCLFYIALIAFAIVSGVRYSKIPKEERMVENEE